MERDGRPYAETGCRSAVSSVMIAYVTAAVAGARVLFARRASGQAMGETMGASFRSGMDGSEGATAADEPGTPARADRDGAQQWRLVAYATSEVGSLSVAPVPAPKGREWINATPNGFARRCLPLMMANQAGWVVRTPVGFRACWDGSAYAGGIEFQFTDPANPARTWVSDHFGAGIITFHIPYLFRTPPGIELLVRGAPNFWIDGAHPLEGLVETDWATMTFTMNWRVVAPNRWVMFDAGDPVCFLQPISAELIETAEPVIADLADAPELEGAYRRWSASRDAFNADPRRRPESWQKDYFLGKAGEPPPRHRTQLQVAPFAGAPELGEQASGKAGAPALPDARYAKVAGLATEEFPGAFVVTDPGGRVHQLNHSAMFILECCTGDVGSSEVAEIVDAAFPAARPVDDLVRQGLHDLLTAGLITEVE